MQLVLPTYVTHTVISILYLLYHIIGHNIVWKFLVRRLNLLVLMWYVRA